MNPSSPPVRPALTPSATASRPPLSLLPLLLAFALGLLTAAPGLGQRQIIAPEGSDLGLPFSAAVATPELLYLSGAIGNQPGTLVIEGDMATQTRQTLANLQSGLRAAGLDWSRVVDARIYVTHSHGLDAAAGVYLETVGRHPVTTTVGGDIALVEAEVEVSMIAAMPGVEMRPIRPEGWPESGSRFSWGMMAGRTLFLAGMVANDPATGKWVGGDITAQTRRAMENVGKVLDAAGLGYHDLVRCRVFLQDPRHYNAMNEAYGAFLGDTPPARATVRARLLVPGAKIEIQCTAVRSDDRRVVMPKGAKPSGRPFSPAIAANGMLYLAGMVGRVDGAYPPSVEAQTRATLDSLAATLKAAGLGFGDVVNATVYLTDVRDYGAMNKVYAEVVGQPPPARATVGMPLMSSDARVEIQMTALLRDASAGD